MRPQALFHALFLTAGLGGQLFGALQKELLIGVGHHAVGRHDGGKVGGEIVHRHKGHALRRLGVHPGQHPLAPADEAEEEVVVDEIQIAHRVILHILAAVGEEFPHAVSSVYD